MTATGTTAPVQVEPEVARRFPDVAVRCAAVVVGDTTAVQAEADRVWAECHARWSTVGRAELRRHPPVAAYRRLAERTGLDPDRQAPSVQALVDRGLRNKPLGRWPRIGPVVDLLNATAVATMTALGAFDADRITGPVRLRFSVAGEPFRALGTDAGAPLGPGRLVLADDVRVLSLFGERDGVHQAVRPDTRSVLALGCVADGIAEESVVASIDKVVAVLQGHG